MNTAHPSGLVLRTPDLARARPPRWAWQDRVVLGYLNLLIGNEGVGKGTLAAWMIARLTRGELPGDLHGEPVNVGILGDEDGFDDVWTPRLYAAGADLSRVRQLERPDGGFVHITEDRAKIEVAVAGDHLRVLFFDALLDNLGAGTDDWRTKAVREALQPLRARRGAAQEAPVYRVVRQAGLQLGQEVLYKLRRSGRGGGGGRRHRSRQNIRWGL
jgi:hypothetical protein